MVFVVVAVRASSRSVWKRPGNERVVTACRVDDKRYTVDRQIDAGVDTMASVAIREAALS